MTKHKHYDCIVAWADGAKIEFFSPIRNIWEYTNEPSWLNNIEYRIKKEPVIEAKYFVRDVSSVGIEYRRIKEICEDAIKLRVWDLKITYQDGKAIKAEVAE